jgi:hypothetical protein
MSDDTIISLACIAAMAIAGVVGIWVIYLVHKG